MSLPKLLDLFSNFQKLPVDVEMVRDAIVNDYKMVDEIKFVAANLDPNIVKGIFLRYQDIAPPYKTGRDVVRIFYANTMSEEWIRLVRCKEMLHIFDVTEAHSLTQEDIQFLIEGLTLPKIAPLLPVHDALEAEACALLLALHLLAPEAALDELRPAYAKKSLSIVELAKRLSLPADKIPFLFSDIYKRHVDKCLNSIAKGKFVKEGLSLIASGPIS